MKFALVILETAASRQHIREHRAEHRAAIEQWIGGLAQSGKLLGGEAFETEAMGPITVRHNGAEVSVEEAPFCGNGETLGGYFIVDAADRDDAISLARTWPAQETIEVRPIWSADQG